MNGEKLASNKNGADTIIPGSNADQNVVKIKYRIVLI